MLIGAIRGDVVAAYFVGDALSPSTGNVFVFPADQAYAAYLVALVAITLGVLVWDRRPDSRTGILLIAFPLASVLADPIVFPGSRLAVTVGLAAVWLSAAIAAHLILSYPTGRFTSRLERGFVALAYGFAFAYALPLLLFYDPRPARSRRLGVLLLRAAAHARGLARRNRRETRARRSPCRVDRARHGAPSAQDHPRCAGGAERRAAARGRGFVGAARFGFLIGFRTFAPSSDIAWSSAWFWSATFVMLAISVALAAGMLWGGAGRGAVADLVVELERTPPGSVRDALARSLGDPSLKLALWLPERGRTSTATDGRSSCRSRDQTER